MISRYYFEDFLLGREIDLGEREISEADIIGFGQDYDPQYFHIDPQRASSSIYGGIIASGWQVASTVMRMTVDNLMSKAACLGSPGVDNIRWISPVRPGDRIKAVCKIIETRRSQSKPERGTVTLEWHVQNQQREEVMTMKAVAMFACRTPAYPTKDSDSFNSAVA